MQSTLNASPWGEGGGQVSASQAGRGIRLGLQFPGRRASLEKWEIERFRFRNAICSPQDPRPGRARELRGQEIAESNHRDHGEQSALCASVCVSVDRKMQLLGALASRPRRAEVNGLRRFRWPFTQRPAKCPQATATQRPPEPGAEGGDGDGLLERWPSRTRWPFSGRPKKSTKLEQPKSIACYRHASPTRAWSSPAW